MTPAAAPEPSGPAPADGDVPEAPVVHVAPPAPGTSEDVGDEHYGAAPPVRRARFAELDARTWHDLVRLRVDVFVVEQACPYPELDGRDVEPGTEHLWVPDESGPVAYLRVLADADGAVRVGRVCVRQDARHLGLASALLHDVLARHGSRRVVLAAQSYLVPFYRRHGFHVSGGEFVEDGIPHVPMERASEIPWR